MRGEQEGEVEELRKPTAGGVRKGDCGVERREAGRGGWGAKGQRKEGQQESDGFLGDPDENKWAQSGGFRKSSC